MKKLIILFLVLTFFYSNLFAQNNYTENIVSDVSRYAGVYEGNLDTYACCEMYETGFGKIVFYFNGDSLKCMYDGLFLNEISLVNNKYNYTDFFTAESDYQKEQVLGAFVIDNKNNEGFLYTFQESRVDESLINFPGTTTFLKKIGDSEMARKIYLEAEEELNEFKMFESEFRKAFEEKNGSKLLSMINFPFYSRPPFNDFYDTKEYWQQDLEISNKSGMKRLMKDILNTNLSDGFSKYQNSEGGAYRITSDKIYFYFKKIGSSFKLVYITGGYG